MNLQRNEIGPQLYEIGPAYSRLTRRVSRFKALFDNLDETVPEYKKTPFQQYAESVESLYERDSIAGDKALDTAIQRQYKAYAAVMQQQEEVAPQREREPQEKPLDPAQAYLRWWLDEAIKDRRGNALFEEYINRVKRVRPEVLELEEFSEIVAARALLRLLAYVPNGPALLDYVWEGEDKTKLPNREDAITAIANQILDETDEEIFLSRLFWEVPGSRHALYQLLGCYKEVVRQQAEKDSEEQDTELPGDELRNPAGQATMDQVIRLIGIDAKLPNEPALVEDLNLERAVFNVLRNAMSIRKASKQFGVPFSRVQREVIRRNKEQEEEAVG